VTRRHIRWHPSSHEHYLPAPCRWSAQRQLSSYRRQEPGPMPRGSRGPNLMGFSWAADSSGCRRVLCVRVAPARQALQVKQKTCESKFFFSFLAFPLFSNYGQTMLPPETAWGDRLLRRNLHHEGVLTRTEGAAGAAAGVRLMRT